MPQPVELRVGLQTWAVTVPPEKTLALQRAELPTAPAESPRDLVRGALEAPFGFEPLRRALVPDDRVVIVFDPNLPHPAELLAGVLDHLGTAGITPATVTVITQPETRRDWIEALPPEFAAVTAQTHDPTDRAKLAYLGSTQSERRIYLNRTLVESDFVIVLTGRRFDPVRFYAGAQVAIYPDLADEALRAENAGPYTSADPWPGREESIEVAWMLGMPFLVQAIEDEGDTVREVVAGLLGSEEEGRRRQDARWKAKVPEKATVVIATVSGAADRVTFADLARAAACAARVVEEGGRIVLLSDAPPQLGAGAQMLRTLDGPRTPLRRLEREKPADWAACKQWVFAARTASMFVASGYPDDVVEELFATPLHTPAELQRLMDSAGSVLIIPDAHKSKVTVE